MKLTAALALSAALSAAPAPALAEAGPPSPSADEARVWAQRVHQGLQSGSAAFLAGEFHVPSLVERTVEGLDLPPALRSGLAGGLGDGSALFAGISAQLEAGSDISFLRVRKLHGRQSALFRIAPPDGGVSYMDFMLGRLADGRVAAVDFLQMALGQTLSELLRTNVLTLIRAQGDRSLLQKLTGRDSALLESVGATQTMSRQVAAGDPRAALRTWATLPKEAQALRHVAALRIAASHQLEEDGPYLEAIEDYGRLFPGGASHALYSIDAQALNGNWDEALKAIDALERSVGGDPLLDELRGNFLSAAGRHAEAAKAFRRLSESMPDYEDAWWALVAVAVDSRDHASVGPSLEELEKRFGHDPDEILSDDFYADYRSSSAHAAWRRGRLTRAATGR